MDIARSGPVVLVEPNPLPCAEQQSAVCDNQRDRRPDKGRLYMSRGIAFAVGEFYALRGNHVKREVDVSGHVWIGVFVDCDRCGCVRHKDHADSFAYAGTGDSFLHFARDIYPVSFAARAVDFFGRI